MAKKPVSAMVMHPIVRDELLREDHLQRLGQCSQLLSTDPVESLDALGADAGRVEVLITSWGCPRIEADHLQQIPRLRLVAHLAGSVKGFLDDAVWRRGIRVTNAVAANAVPVAEFTIAAIIFCNKRVLQLATFYQRHRENRAPWTKEAPGAGNYGKIIGIIGASHVGRLVIERLRQMDVQTLLYDPYITPMAARDLGAHKVSLSELMSKSDIVSLHAPLLEETRGMLGSRELSMLKDGATLINTARGQLVDQEALLHELANGRVSAVLDTTTPEVLPADHPFYELPNVLLTPHIAGSLGSETQRLSDYLIDEIERFAKGAQLKYLVKREHLNRLA